MSDDREKDTVIGYKKKIPKVVAKESDLNGASPSFPPYTAGTDLAFSRKYSTVMPLFFTPTSHICIYPQARRSGAPVNTGKKPSTGGNKAHQGTCVQPPSSHNISH
jgi:hypothetical protein